MQGKRKKMPNSRHNKPTISLRLSGAQLAEVDRLVRQTGMRSRTEFIERAIGRYVEELSESKIVVARSWTEGEARKAILQYLKGGRSARVSELIEALGMEPDQAFRIVDSLIEEGAVDGAA